MFSSSKLSESSRNFQKSLLVQNNESIDESHKSFAVPKVTSTPRNSIFATPPKSLVLTPRRYSLSEVATPPRSNRREYLHSNSFQNPPGPLLASTKYNINVSTFEDIKSPGLASRIVQYNEEAEREKEQQHPPTHQAKYGSLGLFPVVHLFKKKLPLLEQKPRHVSVRVASPDYMKHTPDYNRRLLEGIVRPSSSNQRCLSHSNLSENSTSTRSVLDALKEISRKRIHSHEEFELHEEAGKRLRTDSEDCTDSNKRLRDESLLVETTSPSRPASKKICMYDEYAASRSSMDFLKKADVVVPKRKSISISTLTENSKDSKQVKLINAETQTIPEEEPNKKEPEDTNIESNQNEKPEKVETILKVFDDAPLERIRKNRLAALMGTLVGKDPILEPKPDYSTLLQDEDDKPIPQETLDLMDKPLVSILTQNKSPIKSDKHVHFNIPESNTQNDSLPVPTSTENLISKPTDTLENQKIEIAAPPLSSVSSALSIPTFSFGNKSTSNISSQNSTSTSINNMPSLFSKNSTTKSTPSFGAISKSPVSTDLPSSPPKVGGFKFDLAKPVPSASTPKKPAFPTVQPTATNLVSNSTSVTTFGSPLANAVSLTNNQTKANVSAAEMFTKMPSPFACKVSQASNNPSFSFGTPSNAKSGSDVGKTVSLPASTGSDILPGVLSSTNSGFSAVTTSAKTSFSTFTSVANKGLITSPSVTSNFGSTSASVLPTFSTGVTTNNVTFNAPTFGNVHTTNSSTFGYVSTTNSTNFGIGNNTGTGGFGTSSGFGLLTTSSISGFGTNTPSVNSSTSGFGTNTPSVNSSFGTPKTTSSFGPSITSGTPTTSSFGVSNTEFGTFATSASNIFGSSATPANTGFGIIATSNAKTPANDSFASQPAVGITASTGGGFSTSSTASSGFGTPTTTNGGFGTPTTTNGGFGSGNFSTTTGVNNFGTPTTLAFGFGGANSTVSTFGVPTTAVNTGFGQTSAGFATISGSLFGNPNIPSFGSSSNATSFGSNSAGSSFTDVPFKATTTAASSVFGSIPPTTTTATPSFINESNKIFGGATASFGTHPSTTTSTMFGTTQSPFGGSITTAPSPAVPFAFAAKTTANNTFGTANTTTASFGMGFGQNTTAFANQQSSNFETPNKAPIFGNTNNIAAFGGPTTTSAPAFGTTQQQQQSFSNPGSVFNRPQSPPQNAFGSSQFFNQHQPQQQNNTSNFGQTANQPGVFTFGSGAPEKSGAFNFSSASTGEAPKKFDFTSGNAAPPAFGAAFGNSTAPPVPNFGAAVPNAGGFSIGAGPPSSGRPRPMIKGKRRT